MIRLIGNELYKIIHKKSTWITVCIILGFISLVTFIYSKDYLNEKETSFMFKDNIGNIIHNCYSNPTGHNEELLFLYNYRIENNVWYNNDYLDIAIKEIEENLPEYIELKEKKALSKLEENRFDNINGLVLRNKYILNNRIDVDNPHSLKMLMQNFFEEYSLLIIIFIILISGSTVSDEFQKGTIKSLLVVPYSRIKILLSKMISVFIITALVILFLGLYQFLLGGLVFDFNTLNIPVLVYNYSTNQLIVVSWLKYVMLMFLGNAPLYVMIAIISFMLSTLLCNTGLAITLSFLLVLFSNGVNDLIVNNNISWLQYILTLNWDFSNYLFGGLPIYDCLSLSKSVVIYIIYLGLFILFPFRIFSKRDIKNGN